MGKKEVKVNHENIELDKFIQKLMVERSELIRNLDSLKRSFDECVHDLTRERRNVDGQNDWNSKLIVAKIVFEML